MIYIWTDMDWSIPYPYTEHINSPNFSENLSVFWQQKVSRMYSQNEWESQNQFVLFYGNKINIWKKHSNSSPSHNVGFWVTYCKCYFKKYNSLYLIIKCWHIICNPHAQHVFSIFGKRVERLLAAWSIELSTQFYEIIK